MKSGDPDDQSQSVSVGQKALWVCGEEMFDADCFSLLGEKNCFHSGWVLYARLAHLLKRKASL